MTLVVIMIALLGLLGWMQEREIRKLHQARLLTVQLFGLLIAEVRGATDQGLQHAQTLNRIAQELHHPEWSVPEGGDSPEREFS